ncbi:MULTISPECIES: glycosyltransferase family 4 protein [unclassified Rhodanobacter]|uniref:glycosyltransferase family 4 protein n=1 Tax=unclassified Rhodanobacter TaxID=2621553 RepID=UPI0009869902|nr:MULTISPECIES: glycosyltransferase family 4 protein [unclassified Rhodanobacter]OOG37790.1 glycosyl transferase family 1 [Rhodanobacter sp. C05]OOG66256.1 glycosyl transferase family 1 [Rhodanobacter sp. B04]
MKQLKVTLYSKYSRMGASSRLRSLQYVPVLEQQGIEVQVRERFSDAYLKARYGGNLLALGKQVWRSYWQRIVQLSRKDEYDVVWLEGELFPKLPYWFESMLRRTATPYVADYDDALFHNYDMARNPLVRYALGRKIDKVMQHAACVIAGNGYLAARATQAGAKRVEIIPTVVDHRRYAVVTHGERAQPVIGWIGSPSTQKYLLDIRDALRQVCAKHDARLLLVGASAQMGEQLAGIPIEIVPWSEASEAASIARMDIGVMPLIDGPWERGKCGYKLIQYMACGLPVVASPVGVNTDIVQHGTSGFLAADTIAWQESLARLVLDVSLRRRMGRSGRERVEHEYCLEVQAPRLAEVLRSVGIGGVSRRDGAAMA